jgi:hypothetical protein
VAAAFVATLAVGRGLGPWRTPAATLAALAVAIAVPLLWFSIYLSVDQLVGGYVDEFALATGLHPFLAKALAAALVIQALVGATWLFSLSEQRRLAGKAVIAALLVSYWGTLWLATKEQLVDRHGRALRCFVVTEAGVLYRDITYQGIDPETGRPCEPVRAELIPTLARLNVKLGSEEAVSPLPGVPERFFSAATGQAIVWYAEGATGEAEFFDTPGFDPRSGAALRPVTRDVVEAHQALVARRKAEAEAAARQAEAERALAARRAEEQRLAAEQERLQREETARREVEAARIAELERQEQAPPRRCEAA